MIEHDLEQRLDAFGQRVRAERMRRGLSLRACADLVRLDRYGVEQVMSDAMLGALERGNRRPSLRQAIAIADALTVPLSSLVGERSAALSELAVDVAVAVNGALAAHGVEHVLHPAVARLEVVSA